VISVCDVSTDADEQMLPHLMQLVRQLICDGDLMLARTMRKKVVEKCEYFRQKHETSQHVKLLSSYQLTVKYVVVSRYVTFLIGSDSRQSVSLVHCA